MLSKLLPVLYLSFVCLCADASDVMTNITSYARVSVSDGSSFETVAQYQDQFHAVFVTKTPGQTIRQVVDGVDVWQFDDAVKKPGTPFVELFVLGHQFHAQILWPEAFYITTTSAAKFEPSCSCLQSAHQDRFGNKTIRNIDQQTRYLLSNTTLIKDGPNIQFTYDDWKEVEGKMLPFTVHIDDGQRQFVYTYNKVKFASDSRLNAH